MADIINVVSPGVNETIEITKKIKKVEHNPGYTVWGNGKTARGGTSMDILEIVKNLGKPEIMLMQFFRDEMAVNQTVKEERPNLVTPTNSTEFTPYMKSSLKKCYSHMECLGILKRFKKGTYMLNPRLYIPAYNKDKMYDLWDSLERKECD